MTGPVCAIRRIRAADQGFVRDAWFRSARRHWTGGDEGLRDRIDFVLDSGRAIVCCGARGEPLIGFATAHEDRLEWVYVKRAFRGRGMGRLLVTSAARGFGSLSHSPTVARSLAAWRSRA